MSDDDSESSSSSSASETQSGQQVAPVLRIMPLDAIPDYTVEPLPNLKGAKGRSLRPVQKAILHTCYVPKFLELVAKKPKKKELSAWMSRAVKEMLRLGPFKDGSSKKERTKWRKVSSIS